MKGPSPKADQLRAMREANATGKTKARPPSATALKKAAAIPPLTFQTIDQATVRAIMDGPQPKEKTMSKKPTKTSRTKVPKTPKGNLRGRKQAAANLKAAKAAKSAKTPEEPAGATAKTEGGVRPGSKLEAIVGLLKRPEGCTTKDALAITGWPAISMPQMARQAHLELRKEKVDGVTVYRAA